MARARRPHCAWSPACSQPDRGSIAVFGIDALADPIGAKRIMAWVSDEPMIYDKLTPMEYLDFVAGLWAVDSEARRGAGARPARPGSVWRRTPTNAASDCPRACVRRWRWPARSCMSRSSIILDEPFTGLDAGSSRVVKEVLRERVHAGCSVIMTTHILDVAERMADRIGVMANGRLIADGTLDELRLQAGSGHASLEDTFLALVAQDAVAA